MSDPHYACLEQWPGYWGTGLKEACIIGMGSDIGSNLAERLSKDGWEIWGTTRKDVDLAYFVDATPKGRWDLLLLVAGTLEPIGRFFETEATEWEKAIRVNALGHLRVLRSMWPYRKSNATVVFFGGPNLQKDTPSYTAYRAGKALLSSMVGTLNAEYPICKFVMFDPGVVNTKIHQQTIRAGAHAENYQAVLEIVSGVRPSVSYDEMYRRLQIAVGINPFPENEGT
jgi:NAD(P)-dependent dehydrogenase (short-subunit alcohol dehydrogenase family)